MILLLHGEDSFHSWRKLQTIKERFLTSQDANNLNEYSADQLESQDIGGLLAPSLWSGHRLIVMRDIMGAGSAKLKDTVLAVLEYEPDPNLTLIFWESGSFDHRQKLFKLLNKPKLAEEFKMPFPAQLPSLVNHLATELGVKLSPAQINKLVAGSDNDCWKIYQEISKLSSAPESLLDDLISPSQQSAAFALQDAISNGSPAEAHRTLLKNLLGGDDPHLLMGGLASTLRNIILIATLNAQGKDQRAMATETGIHPFVIKKLSQLSSTHPVNYWSQLYQELSNTDWKIKTGALSSDGALDPTVVKLAA